MGFDGVCYGWVLMVWVCHGSGFTTLGLGFACYGFGFCLWWWGPWVAAFGVVCVDGGLVL